MPDTYPNIADHGLIGDLQTAALVATDGTIDWFCAAAVRRAERLRVAARRRARRVLQRPPDGRRLRDAQLYLPDTAILITRFLTEAGVGEVVDFMPIAGDEATDRHRLVRMLRVVRGTMSFVAEVQPRFDYGRDAAHDRRRRGRGRHLLLRRARR